PSVRERIAGSGCCVTGMTCQSLSSKWLAAKARRGSMSFVTCERGATQAPRHFQLNPAGRSSLGEFLRRSLGRYRDGYRRFACFLKFAQTPRGDWQGIPVTQQYETLKRLMNRLDNHGILIRRD